MKACIFDIKRFAIHDGPGIRTTVFFKGCPLGCHWCHNPEGINGEIEHFTEEVLLDGVKMKKETEVGRWVEVDQLMGDLERDRVFMEESGGGISFSGGEPLMQANALGRMLEISRERNIHTAVDTSGYASPDIMEKVSRLADLILYDLKIIDDQKHREYTGVSNSRILDNLDKVLEGPAEVLVRIPVITGFNDTDRELESMVSYLQNLGRIKEVDILPYHPYGTHKYRRFRMENRQNGFKTPGKPRLGQIEKMFSDAGFRVRTGG
jgi:pyruvate formate lyase activating enzyme